MTSPPATAEHWDRTYAEGDTSRSWYQPHATVSMDLLAHAGVPPSTAIVDVGGGASTLVDDLLHANFTDVTVLDVAPTALGLASSRVGPDLARQVNWVVADIESWLPSRTYGVWHDRAVLHFMVDRHQQAAYRRALMSATAVDSIVIIAVFSTDGPQQCSGLTVRRYDEQALSIFLGDEFEVVETREVPHQTPGGAEQEFLWLMARRTS